MSYRGADVLVRTLKSAGIQTIYTLSGNHVMPVFDAALDNDLRLIHVRHEAAAVHMADAAARITGNVAIAMVTGGPGHANAVSALYTALQSESPVVLLSGHAPLSQLGKGAFQEMDQVAVAAPCVKASIMMRSAQTLSQDLAAAIRLAKSGRPGPVAVCLPQDVLDAVLDAPKICSADAFIAPSAPADDALIQRIVQELKTATRPVILTGAQALQAPHRHAIAQCQNALGIPVIGMESPRGVNDPALGAFSSVLKQADLIVLIGKKIDFTLKFADSEVFSPETRFLVVDPDQSVLDHATVVLGSRCVASGVGDAVPTLAALTKNSGRKNPQQSDWGQQSQAMLSFVPPEWPALATTDSRPLHPLALLEPIIEFVKTQQAIVVCDGGEFGQWVQSRLKPEIRLINGAAGAIGAAIPMAIGAALERPEAVVITFMGDGAFGFHATEFDTAVRHGAKFICVVGNDACWNAEYQIQLRTYGQNRLIGCELLPIRYDRVASAYGAQGLHCESSAEIRAALAQALQEEKAVCLNVPISRSAAPSVKVS